MRDEGRGEKGGEGWGLEGRWGGGGRGDVTRWLQPGPVSTSPASIAVHTVHSAPSGGQEEGGGGGGGGYRQLCGQSASSV